MTRRTTIFRVRSASRIGRFLPPDATRIGAKRTYFTHMSHDLEHEATNSSLPDGMELAYDGLRIPLT